MVGGYVFYEGIAEVVCGCCEVLPRPKTLRQIGCTIDIFLPQEDEKRNVAYVFLTGLLRGFVWLLLVGRDTRDI